VVRDRDRSADAPEQIFTPRNSRGYQWTKAFPRLPEGLGVNFRVASRDCEMRQITVFRRGISSDTGRLEQVAYEGLVTEAEVTARATYDLERMVQRAVFHLLEAPAEAIICCRGSLVGVQHDSVDEHSGSGRVIDITLDGAGDITAIKLDAAVPVRNNGDFLASPDILALGAQTGVMIRRATEATVHRVTNASGTSDTLTFSPAIDPAGIGIGTLVSVGPLNREVLRLLVFTIYPAPDLTATLTFANEAPGILPDLAA